MRFTLAFDVAAGTGGPENATPRVIGGNGSSWAANGTVFKGPSRRFRLLGIIAVPKLTDAQRAGAAGDVVAYRNTIDATAFSVESGEVCLLGPVWGAAVADGLPGSAGGPISDPGGQGDGFLADEQTFQGATGISVECGRTAAATISVPWTVLVTVEG